MANLYLHFYASTSLHYSPDKFADYLRGNIDADHPFDRFSDAGVNLAFRPTAAQGPHAFKESLRDDGSVVVYLGHGVPDPKTKRSLGLSFFGNGIADIPAITVAKPGQPKPPDLTDLLKDSRAKLVVLATCASSTFGLDKLKTGPAVVVTNSGPNLVTYSALWGKALQHFLLLLIGYEVNAKGEAVVGLGPVTEIGDILKNIQPRATIREALEAANAAFKEFGSTDRCELAHGEGSTVVFPK
jgi:hypothetical protein